MGGSRTPCRPVARTLVLLLVLGVLMGCSGGRQEPGLFGRSPRPTTIAPSPPDSPPTVATRPNPDLPVVGEALWSSADGTGIQLRVAVHALRKIAGATVLDWSITPLRGVGLGSGDRLPVSLDLGLDPPGSTAPDIFLIDVVDRKVYRPLVGPAATGRSCLCTPLLDAQRQLMIGHTRLLQTAFPRLPADVSTVDVDIATVPLFWHVPVTSPGLVPQATSPTDLSRAGDTMPPASSARSFSYPATGQRFLVSVDEVIASSTFTSLQWTVQTLTDGPGLANASSPPFAAATSPTRLDNPVVASGPVLTVSGVPSARTRPLDVAVRGSGGGQCLCSDLRGWTTSLRHAEQRASVVTNYAALPRSAQSVDVTFPGLPTLRDVGLTSASDGTVRSAGPLRRASQTWTATQRRLPDGWAADQWPTPLPDPDRVQKFRAEVDDLLR